MMPHEYDEWIRRPISTRDVPQIIKDGKRRVTDIKPVDTFLPGWSKRRLALLFFAIGSGASSIVTLSVCWLAGCVP